MHKLFSLQIETRGSLTVQRTAKEIIIMYDWA